MTGLNEIVTHKGTEENVCVICRLFHSSFLATCALLEETFPPLCIQVTFKKTLMETYLAPSPLLNVERTYEFSKKDICGPLSHQLFISRLRSCTKSVHMNLKVFAFIFSLLLHYQLLSPVQKDKVLILHWFCD